MREEERKRAGKRDKEGREGGMGGRQRESERESNDLGVYNTITKNILRINRNGIITIIVIKEMS